MIYLAKLQLSYSIQSHCTSVLQFQLWFKNCIPSVHVYSPRVLMQWEQTPLYVISENFPVFFVRCFLKMLIYFIALRKRNFAIAALLNPAVLLKPT